MSSQEEKINVLLDRLRQESRTPQNNSMSSNQQQNSPRGSSRARLQLSLNRPRDLNFTPTHNVQNETDQKLKEIMKISGNITINETTFKTDVKDLENLEVLGNGTCGHVVKMRHRPSNEIIAVKQMRRSGNNDENKRIIMDIEVVLKSHDCKYIVQCLGCFITDSEVWICMELMTTCFDKLLKRLERPIPEEILGKVTVATVEALSYLKDKHGVIHRDVKPSNILLDTKGFVKLCDFGISGRLVDSLAKTRSAGCTAYLAPERIEPDPKNPDYDIRADVWSLGITLVELATGVFPYPDCETDFEVLTKVIGQDPPSLPENFSPEFRDFVKSCLIKDQKQRPKYGKLKNHPFIKKYETKNVDVGAWVINAIQQADAVANRTASRPSQSSFRRFFTSTNHKQPPIVQLPQQPSYDKTNGNAPSCFYRPLKLLPSESAGAKVERQPADTTSPPPQENPPTSPPNRSHNSRLSTFHNASSHQRDQVDAVLKKTRSPFQAYQNHLAAVAAKADTHPQEMSSPMQPRRIQSESRWRSPSASPLPLRNQFQNQEQQYNCGNTSPIILQRFFHQQKQQQLAREAEESGKKRFASYIKLQLGGDRSGRSSRHQSPDPPPRLNRTASGDHSSLAVHRNYLESTNTTACSPNLSRRYVSPTPPTPPPRRLSESTSVPGSPQHLRARFHYTPEPQRRLYQNSDVL